VFVVCILCDVAEADNTGDGDGPDTAVGAGARSVSFRRRRTLQPVSVPERFRSVTGSRASECLETFAIRLSLCSVVSYWRGYLSGARCK